MPWTTQTLKQFAVAFQKDINEKGFVFHIPGPKKASVTTMPNITIKQFKKVEEVLKDNVKFVLRLSLSEQVKAGDARKVDFIFATHDKPIELYNTFDYWLLEGHKNAAQSIDGGEFINFTSRVRGILKEALERVYGIKLESSALN